MIDRTKALPLGHAAGFAALSFASKELEDGCVDFCIVGGVDSYLHAETLQWIEDSGQLHS